MRDFCRALALVLATLTLAACQTTSIKSAWFDPGYTGGAMKKIVVVGVGGNLANRRVFEDIFAQKLRAAGVDEPLIHTIRGMGYMLKARP